MIINSKLKEIGRIFNSHNKKVYLVGGAVRDQIRGKAANDFDIASDAVPGEVQKMFRSVIPTGIKHGTVTILYQNLSIECTTFRSETEYTDSRHPDNISFAATIEEDLSRRDFTMNAIAVELPDGKVVDIFNGISDIKKKIIRTVGNPAMRFGEDALRIMRALRFASQLGFNIDNETLAAIPPVVPNLDKISAERIREEFDKTIMSNKPSTALLLMEQTGILECILPELSVCRGIEQKGYHKFDVLEHSLLALDYAAKNNYEHDIRLAAILHDIGKVPTRKLRDDGVWTFYDHQKYSAQMALAILTRLKYPNVVIDHVVHLIKRHMEHYEDNWNDAAVRRFLIRVGKENLDAFFKLRLSDVFGLQKIEPDPRQLLEFQKRIDKVIEKGNVLTIKALAVNGTDLMALGIPGGKRIGIILNELLDAVLSDPSLNTKESLLNIARNWIEEKEK